jgi:3-carboxy-cis,cis-muconate cycloisomerase
MTSSPPPSPLEAIFSEQGRLRRFLEFEAALAMAEAELGIIPREAADDIIRIATADTVDLAVLRSETERTGYPIAPLVRQLVAACDGDHGQYVHWGSTTQDVMDTALALQMRQGLDAIEADLKAIAAVLVDIADTHRQTLMVARTFGGHALPFTFGLKAARWLSGICRHVERIGDVRRRAVVGQFGGAVGTLASFGDDGPAVKRLLFEKLDLPASPGVWHVARDSVAEAVCYLGLVTTTLGKIAHDVMALSATEIGELAEPVSGGKDTSSALPQKRNPVYSGRVVAAAKMVAGHVALVLDATRHDHERGPQGFVEERVVPDAFVQTGRALATTLHVLSGLTVDAGRMRANLDAPRGMVMAEAATMALAPHLGRLAAKDLVHAACEEAMAGERSLASVIGDDATVGAHLGAADIERIMDPANYLGSADDEVDEIITLARTLI